MFVVIVPRPAAVGVGKVTADVEVLAELGDVGLDRRDHAGQPLEVAGEDRRVDDVAADGHVADRPVGDDPRVEHPAVGLEVLDLVGQDRRRVRPPAEEDVADAGRGEDRDVVGLAADVEVGDLAAGEDREVGRVAADPDEADLADQAGGRVGQRRDDRPAGEARRVGATAVLPSISLAWNRLSRPATWKTTLSWVGEVVVVLVEAAAAWPLDVTLLTMMSVPLAIGRPRRIRNWSLVVLALRATPVPVAKETVVSAPPKRSELIPSGMVIDAAGAGRAVVGRGRVGVGQVEVGDVDREDAEVVARPLGVVGLLGQVLEVDLPRAARRRRDLLDQAGRGRVGPREDDRLDLGGRVERRGVARAVVLLEDLDLAPAQDRQRPLVAGGVHPGDRPGKQLPPFQALGRRSEGPRTAVLLLRRHYDQTPFSRTRRPGAGLAPAARDRRPGRDPSRTGTTPAHRPMTP